jgi:bleomycin hydrolase
MKNITLIILCSFLLLSCGKQAENNKDKNPFVVDILLKTTPVKDQGQGSLCWAYAMLSTIETNHLMQGDSVNLSVDYIARRLFTRQALQNYLSNGKKHFNQRGMASMLIHIIQQEGAIPFDSYYSKDEVNYNILCRKLAKAVRAAHGFGDVQAKADAIMDSEIGYMPAPSVHMLGATYTPLEFAHSVCRENEYDNYTSFAHHPFGSRFILETPDNLMNDSFLNLPIDGLMNLIVNRLKNGRAVCCEGDISEPGFDAENGVGEVPEKKVTQEMRQQQFESLKTTDDHCMSIVGMAHDKQGNRYFIMKNSWGTSNRFHGFIYLSYNYVKLKTIAVFL